MKSFHTFRDLRLTLLSYSRISGVRSQELDTSDGMILDSSSVMCEMPAYNDDVNLKTEHVALLSYSESDFQKEKIVSTTHTRCRDLPSFLLASLYRDRLQHLLNFLPGSQSRGPQILSPNCPGRSGGDS